MSEKLTPYLSKLQDVKYSSRYVMGLFYPHLSKLNNVDWSAKYIYDNPCIRYVAMDTVKRNKGKTFSPIRFSQLNFIYSDQ